jgi:hypothetical protein
LQTLGRWVLAFTTMSRAHSSGAVVSSTMWTTPAPVSMTGTDDSVTTVSMSSALPRGTSTSTMPRACMSSRAPSRPNSSTVWIASGSIPHSARAPRIARTRAAFVRSAAEPPRSTTALPERSASAAMSTVTLGRAS